MIVNVSTSVGQRAWPDGSVYAATKTALELLTRSWAVELAPTVGIACVVVAGIGVTRTGSRRTATSAGIPPEAQPYVQEAS